MSGLKALNFVVMPKVGGGDVRLARRHKLIMQLEQQRALAADPNYVVPRQKWVKQSDGSKALVECPKRVKRWWQMDGAGNTFLIVRYGARVLELDKGKSAIAVGARDKLASTITAVMDAVAAGELDAAIDAVRSVGKAIKRKAP
jgi:hypothetical protein